MRVVRRSRVRERRVVKPVGGRDRSFLFPFGFESGFGFGGGEYGKGRIIALS